MAAMKDGKPVLIDLFCKAGGATRGYQQAGFYVIGVDIEPQPHYIGDEFYQANALTFPLDRADAIHASPPCQKFARIGAVHGHRDEHPDLLEPTRLRLLASGRPWLMENVPDAKLPNSIVLCGSMFGLGAVGTLDGVYRQLRRHRLFELAPAMHMLTPACQHRGEPVGVYGRGGPQRATRNRGYMGGREERKAAMEIDWMDVAELSNAIPPTYTKFLGGELLKIIQLNP